MLAPDLLYDWFSPSDFQFIAEQLGRLKSDSFPPIIVGGQSLVGWAQLLDIPIPKTDTPYVTRDLDLICPNQTAQWLAEQLGVKLSVPDIHDATPQTGKLCYRPSPERGLLVIDFLSAILGPDTKTVRRLAVPVQYNGQTLHLLQPILCLHSRLANLYSLREKRNGNGYAQAEVAILVAGEYLRKLAENNPTLALWYVREIVRIATTKEGVFCFVEWGFDPLRAIYPCVFSHKIKYLGKYRYHEPLRRLFKKREVGIHTKLGQAHQRRDLRGQREYIEKELHSTMSTWGCRNIWRNSP